MSAGVIRERPAPHSVTPLPDIEEMASVPVDRVPSMLIHLSALQAALAARLADHPTHPTSLAGSPAGLVKAKQLATHLSLRLDRVYELARTGRIPCSRTGKRALRFDVEAVRKALAA